MTSHVYLADIDPEWPATLSKKIIKGVLRGELAYEGVVISDDLLCRSKNGMVLVNLCSIPEAGVKALAAGVDIIMLSDANYARPVHAAIKEALAGHRLSEEELDRSVARILKLKKRFGIF